MSSSYLGRTPAFWTAMLDDTDALRRRLAAHALAEIGTAAAGEATEALVATINDAEAFVRVWAAAALGRLDPGAPGVLETLEEAMTDPRSFVRSLTAWHVGRLGPSYPGVRTTLSSLQHLASDADADVRSEAAVAMRRLSAERSPSRGVSPSVLASRR